MPINADSKTFNPTVYFRTIFDTTYQDVEETYLDKIDTIISERVSTNPQISSQNALNGNTNFVKTSFQLPPNTIAWSYYISTSQEAQKTIEKDRDEFAKTAKGTLSGVLGMDPMAAVALGGLNYFTKIQGEDNVKFEFSKRATQERPSFIFKTGDTKGESNQVLTPLTGTIDIKLTNDNMMEPINVTLKVTSVSVNNIYNKRMIKKANITSRSVPFTK